MWMDMIGIRESYTCDYRESQSSIFHNRCFTYHLKTFKVENDNLFVTIDQLRIIKNPRKSQENSWFEYKKRYYEQLDCIKKTSTWHWRSGVINLYEKIRICYVYFYDFTGKNSKNWLNLRNTVGWDIVIIIT